MSYAPAQSRGARGAARALTPLPRGFTVDAVGELVGAEPPAGPGVDILVVDDNTSNLLALEAVLADLGPRIVRAHSGAEALRRLLDQDFALALLDIQMPDLDGLQTAELIRARDRTRHMPIIFVTAYERSDEKIAQAYALGAVDFLFKPVVPQVLRAKVGALVELSRKTDEVERQARLLREVERREAERRLVEASQRWESERLREEMVRERRVAEALARSVEERERAEEGLRAANQRLLLLSEMANRLLIAADPRAQLAPLCRDLAAHLQLDFFVCHLSVDSDALRVEAAGGLSRAELAQMHAAPRGERVYDLAARRRRPVIAENLQRSRDPLLALERSWGVDAFACFPLVAREHLLGTLSFGARRDGSFEADVMSVLQVVSDQFAMALERARLIDALSQRNRALAEVDRRKDEFLAMLAHELRNPLAPIMNAVQLLGHAEASPAACARARSAIDRQAHHLARLVDDLLDLSRINTGKIELRREPVRLDDVVGLAVQISAPWFEAREQTLSTELPDEAVWLHADATRLAQVVANLLNNAARYSPPRARVLLRATREGPELVLRVIDEGFGIAPEMLDHIFDLFVQSERTPDRAQGGLGIGLTLVRSLVEMHGGRVSARSDGPNAGSEFVVRLPTCDDPGGEARPGDARESAPARARRVVVVEDNDDVRDTLRDYLTLCGHAVSVASDGPSGVELVLSSRPDVALIDIGLPGLDGYHVGAALRARAPDLSTRLIALTGYGQPEDRRRALDAGFDAHLVKPVDPDALGRLLEAP